MKKLIALMFCLAVVAGVARAEYPQAKNDSMQQAVDQQVDKAQRVGTLQVKTGSEPTEFAAGKVVVVGNQKGKLVLLTSQSLAIDIDGLGDDPVFATFVKNQKKTHAMIVEIKAYNPTTNQHFYVITLEGKNVSSFGKLSMLPLQEAKKLL